MDDTEVRLSCLTEANRCYDMLKPIKPGCKVPGRLELAKAYYAWVTNQEKPEKLSSSRWPSPKAKIRDQIDGS
jgi:hypothetical protein